MNTLTRYILKDLFYHFFILIGLFCAILLAKEMYDTRDEIMEEEPAFVDVAQYVGLSIPKTAADSFPLVAMFAVLFSMGLMAKNREIIAMVAAGVSFNRLAVPVVIYGLIITALSYVLTEHVAPAAQTRADYIYQVNIKKENPEEYLSNDDIFRKGGERRFFVMANYNSKDQTMTRPSILDLNEDGSGLARRIEAEKGTIIPGEGETSEWKLENAEEWTFQPGGAFTVKQYDEPLLIEMDSKIETILTREKSAEEMRLKDLRGLTDLLEEQGSENPVLPKYQTSVQERLAIPFSCLLLALIGFAVAADLQVRHFVLAFTVGLGFGIAYFLSREAFAGLGRSGLLSEIVGGAGPYLAAWFPILVFACIAAILMRRLSTVH